MVLLRPNRDPGQLGLMVIQEFIGNPGMSILKLWTGHKAKFTPINYKLKINYNDGTKSDNRLI